MRLEIISEVQKFHCISLAICNTKKNIYIYISFKLKDCSSLIDLLINRTLLEQEF